MTKEKFMGSHLKKLLSLTEELDRRLHELLKEHSSISFSPIRLLVYDLDIEKCIHIPINRIYINEEGILIPVSSEGEHITNQIWLINYSNRCNILDAIDFAMENPGVVIKDSLTRLSTGGKYIKEFAIEQKAINNRLFELVIEHNEIIVCPTTIKGSKDHKIIDFTVTKIYHKYEESIFLESENGETLQLYRACSLYDNCLLLNAIQESLSIND